MKQGQLFEAPAEYLKPNPLCLYEGKCPRQGRCRLGPVRRTESCENRTLTCERCGCHGEQSRNLTIAGRR